MPKLRFVSAILGLIYCSVSFTVTALPFSLDTEPIKTNATECSKLTVTGNPEYPPYLFKDRSNPKALIGANAEIIKEIGHQINIEIDVIYSGPWSRAQKEVREGRIDLITGAFFTEPRSKYMDYIYPAFLITKSVVWVNKNQRIKYSQKEDLTTLKGITVINNSFGQEFDAYAKAQLSITTVASLKQAFTMLKLGRVDYLLYEESPAKAYAASLRVEELVEAIGPAISSEGLYLTISHQSKCNTPVLREKITIALNKLLNQGHEQEALKKGLLLWRNNPVNN
jgi:polar amino acid transport system substrate-binding protein